MSFQTKIHTVTKREVYSRRDPLGGLWGKAKERMTAASAAEAITTRRGMAKRGEKREMKHNYDIIPIPVSVRDRQGRYTYVNRAWVEMFSVDAKSAIGRTDGELELDPLAFPEGEHGTEKGEYVFRDVYITTKEKGRLLLELIETSANDNDVGDVICVHQDMTGIGWRMEDLTRNLSRCEYKTRQSVQNVVRMSRDMGEHLEQMALYCDKLEQSRMDGQQREWLACVRDSATLLQKQVQRCVNLSVLEDSTQVDGNEPLLLPRLFDEVCAMYSGIAEDRQISIGTNLDSSLQEAILGDSQKIRQILVNLLDAALRGSLPGKITLSATVVQDADRPLCLKARVEKPHEDLPDAAGGNDLPILNMGLSHKVLRGLCGLLGGRFEISRDTDGARLLRVYLRLSRPAKTKTGR